MEKRFDATFEQTKAGRVLARTIAADLRRVQGGSHNTPIVTQTNPTKQDITNGTSDHD